jgi:undecaprenyl-diphosphatase
MLILTGTILFFSQRVKVQSGPVKKPSALDAVLIGIGQAAAVIPGLSRSGTTISVGLLRGMEREKAARFSFLLSIPAILGALVFTLGDLSESGSVLGVGPILAGLIASAVTGYMAIRLLLSLIKRGRLVWFSYYTWFVGVLVVLLSMI